MEHMKPDNEKMHDIKREGGKDQVNVSGHKDEAMNDRESVDANKDKHDKKPNGDDLAKIDDEKEVADKN